MICHVLNLLEIQTCLLPDRSTIIVLMYLNQSWFGFILRRNVKIQRCLWSNKIYILNHFIYHIYEITSLFTSDRQQTNTQYAIHLTNCTNFYKFASVPKHEIKSHESCYYSYQNIRHFNKKFLRISLPLPNLLIGFKVILRETRYYSQCQWKYNAVQTAKKTRVIVEGVTSIPAT